MNTLLRWWTKLLFRLFYTIDVREADRLAPEPGKPLLLIANHISAIDCLVLDYCFSTLLHQQITVLAVPTSPADPSLRWWQKALLKPYIRLNPQHKDAHTRLTTLLTHQPCCIFPEQRISTTGKLMKIDAAIAKLSTLKNITMQPIHIKGTERAQCWSNSGSHCSIKQNIRTSVTITIGTAEPCIKTSEQSLRATQLFNSLEQAAFAACDYQYNLFTALVHAACRFGKKRQCIDDDMIDQPLTYRRLLLGALVLGKKIHQLTQGERRIGVLLPTSTAATVTFFACQAYGITPVMLNISAGTSGLRTAIALSGIKLILSSSQFIKQGNFQDIATTIQQDARLIYLETVRTGISTSERIKGLIASIRPLRTQAPYLRQPCEEAVILFTSGSENIPKGVVLSSTNILSNVYQCELRFDFRQDDTVLNCLPVFHCFGLTVGTILPLMIGVKTYMYPSPLHYEVIPQRIYQTQATFFISTDTFYQQYARKAHPYDFHSIRFAVAGAEQVKQTTRDLYHTTFGIHLTEGYGATEAAPVLACNNAIYNKPGSVGRLLPGITIKLRTIPGIHTGKKLLVSGPNVMLGYINPKDPNSLLTCKEWYDTGDIVTIDDHGYINIIGREKRFVKIAGEMISLQRLEQLIETIYPQHCHAAVAIASTKKGEQIVLVTECKTLDKKQIINAITNAGESRLMTPAKIVYHPQIPLLGSGKINHPEVTKIATT